MTIDLHTHFLPERWPDWTKKSGYPGWIELQHTGPGCARMCRTLPSGGHQSFRDVAANLWDPAVRAADMAAAGVATQVLSTVPVMFSHWAKAQDAYDLHRLLNDHLAGVVLANGLLAAHADSKSLPPFLGLGVLPLQDPDLACRELDRCITDLRLSGVQIGTHVNGVNLDDPMLRPVFKRAADLGAAVFVHPWDMLAPERMERYWAPWLVGMPTESTLAIMAVLFSGMLDEMPTLRLCFAHGGGSFPGTLGRIAHGFACRRDLFPPTARDPREYLRRAEDRPAGRSSLSVDPLHARFWVDSLVHDAAALRLLRDLFGPPRVALGSDYPFPLGEDRPGELIRAMPDLSDADRRWLLHDAARAFLGLPVP
jgi:aminocarboxymuconate-semialdehyde decarboxylase